MSAAETVVAEHALDQGATVPDVPLPEATRIGPAPEPFREAAAQEALPVKAQGVPDFSHTEIDIRSVTRQPRPDERVVVPEHIRSQVRKRASVRRHEETVRVERARVVDPRSADDSTEPSAASLADNVVPLDTSRPGRWTRPENRAAKGPGSVIDEEALARRLRRELEASIRAEMRESFEPELRRQLREHARREAKLETRRELDGMVSDRVRKQIEAERERIQREEEERWRTEVSQVRRVERQAYHAERISLERKHRSELDNLQKELKSELGRLHRRVDRAETQRLGRMDLAMLPSPSIDIAAEEGASFSSPTLGALVCEARTDVRKALRRDGFSPGRVPPPLPEVEEEITLEEAEVWTAPLAALKAEAPGEMASTAAISVPACPRGLVPVETVTEKIMASSSRLLEQVAAYLRDPNVRFVLAVTAGSLAVALTMVFVLWGTDATPDGVSSVSEEEAAEVFASVAEGLTRSSASLLASASPVSGNDQMVDDGAETVDMSAATGKKGKKPRAVKKARRAARPVKKAKRSTRKSKKKRGSSLDAFFAKADKPAPGKSPEKPSKIRKPGPDEPFALDLPF